MKKFMSFVLTGAIALSMGVFCPASAFSTVAEENVENDFTEVTYENVKYKKYADHVEVGENISNKELTEVVIPAEIDGLPVKVIGDGAFLSCDALKSVSIPDSVTSIESYAFSCCSNLTAINIPDSVNFISMYAFSRCGSLKSVTISNSITSLSWGVFAGCSGLTSIVIPDSVTEIEQNAFINCSGLKSVTIPNSVTTIGVNAFMYCTSLETVEIPDSVTRIEYSAFEGTPWLEKKRKEGSFFIVNDLLVDGNNCEGDIIIPDSVTKIGQNAFSGYENLESVTIPASVTEIGESAFSYCANLKSITIENPECEIYDNSFTISNTSEFKPLSPLPDGVFNGTIYGYPNSTAQAYAEKYGYKFETIGEQPPTEETEALKGDANGDNSVTIADTVAILQYLANPDEYPLSEQGAKNSDVLGDDGVNTEDALQIQKLDAGVIDKL